MSEPQKGLGRGSPPATPRWVIALGLILVVIILVGILLHLMGFGLGGHGIAGTWNIGAIVLG